MITTALTQLLHIRMYVLRWTSQSGPAKYHLQTSRSRWNAMVRVLHIHMIYGDLHDFVGLESLPSLPPSPMQVVSVGSLRLARYCMPDPIFSRNIDSTHSTQPRRPACRYPRDKSSHQQTVWCQPHITSYNQPSRLQRLRSGCGRGGCSDL